MSDRLRMEKCTVEIMIKLYCKGNHETNASLCTECEELRNYALKRLENCKYREKKPVCGKCKIHCYKPEMRNKIRTVMRKTGPKMMVRYPLSALYHLFCSLKSN